MEWGCSQLFGRTPGIAVKHLAAAAAVQDVDQDIAAWEPAADKQPDLADSEEN